jgi:hypothetical protein
MKPNEKLSKFSWRTNTLKKIQPKYLMFLSDN